jgi:HD-GYP domain-containing protein (c-di-GMP phosphodiesterase class II)
VQTISKKMTLNDAMNILNKNKKEKYSEEQVKEIIKLLDVFTSVIVSTKNKID